MEPVQELNPDNLLLYYRWSKVVVNCYKLKLTTFTREEVTEGHLMSRDRNLVALLPVGPRLTPTCLFPVLSGFCSLKVVVVLNSETAGLVCPHVDLDSLLQSMRTI